MICQEVEIMNLDVRTLILAASILTISPLNPAMANLAHASPTPNVEGDGPGDVEAPGKDDAKGSGGDTPKTAKSKSGLKKAKAKHSGNHTYSDLHCLALNIYHEAGAEPHAGKQAVAAVTLNRVKSDAFPDSVCSVVKQRNKKACQFSWWCSKKTVQPKKDSEAWRQAMEIGRKTLAGQHQDPTQGALYFHATRVKPSWSRTFKKTTRIGKHIFYKPVKAAA